MLRNPIKNTNECIGMLRQGAFRNKRTTHDMKHNYISTGIRF